jgi:hypothetical protein
MMNELLEIQHPDKNYERVKSNFKRHYNLPKDK